MHFLIDENIPLAEEAFSSLGRCDFFSGQAFDPYHVKKNTHLMIRSVTKINSKTFAKNKPVWIGSATAGVDHIDFQFIKKNHIGFDFAPGSNANSVAEYVILTLCHYALKLSTPLNGKSLGVIGCGQVGSRVIQKAKELGMKIMSVDPPLEKAFPNRYPFVPIEKAFRADFVTLHVPLTTTGDHPTFHFITDVLLDMMPPRGLFINTSRGKVIEDSVILKAAERGIEIALDVFENEPGILDDIIDKAFILTPHIAGYAMDGKLKGTQMLYDVIVKKNDIQKNWDYRNYLKKKVKTLNDHSMFTPILSNQVGERKLLIEQNIIAASTPVFDLSKDSLDFRGLLKKAKGDKNARRDLFYAFRKNHNHRFEWSNVLVQIENFHSSFRQKLSKLGFIVR